METTKDIFSERSPKFNFRHRNYKILNNKRLDRFYTNQNLEVKDVEHIETRQYSDHLAVTKKFTKKEKPKSREDQATGK